MILMIDNYDSFTYNIVHYFEKCGEQVVVYFNDQISLDEIEQMAPDFLCLSPGPGSPADSGITPQVIRHFAGRTPMLGICLGMQTMVTSFGGEVQTAQAIMHGKTSMVHHNQQSLFSNIANPFRATRYHSLVVKRESLPDCFEIIAWTDTSEDGEIMAIKHREYPMIGVQFHPESILTEYGIDLLREFIGAAGEMPRTSRGK